MKKIYEIKCDQKGSFLERPNRFIAQVKLDDGSLETVHVHDSGRIKELLFEGNRVNIKSASNPKRKTKWDMISALSDDGEEILINSAYHRYISENIIRDPEISPFGNIDTLKAEVKYGGSRIDYMLSKDNQNIWVEVKGVSLSVDKVAMFPDAPSTRAQKHLKELMELLEKGERAAVLLLIFRNSDYFRPKWETDPVFSELFYEAREKGVEIYPVQLELRDGSINYKGLLPIGGREER
ncbi:DNA/RNA nuclease SfsA [uncultured Ilyobacter sp.]|uniref:DNA/RNA nuclease SfsA n=1 Tax=uncultured Ilyobacter sp. TaxID=544433 RepID=UPI0029C03682|nr:DNA/RNA nuclease SfsA [uncultured Ilyobacter sp.]